MSWTDEDNTELRGWLDRLNLTFPLLFLVGWLLYELTTQPAVGALAVCLKFGWEDFRAAIWLRRVDPQRLRGRACFWLYLSWGLARTAGVASLMSLAFVVISPKGPAAQGPRWAAIMEMAAWTGLTSVASLCCVLMTFGCAAGLMDRGGFKMWLSSDIHRARRHNDWPPYGPAIVQNNRMGFFLITTTFVVPLPLYLLTFRSVLTDMISMFGVRLGIALSVVGGVLFLIAPFVVCSMNSMKQRMFASHPSECWNDAENMAERIGDPLE